MSKRFTGVLATTHVDKDNERFSLKALQQLAEQAHDTHILDSFEERNVIGLLCLGRVTNRGVEVEGILDPDAAIEGFVVPGFMYDEEKDIKEIDGVKVYQKIKLLSVAITQTPADPNLSPIEYLGEE